ncbi:MAG: GTPase Era, partial [Actinobacteria bacterium]|nr:GTPase Era [Actinomycetota bacterium]
MTSSNQTNVSNDDFRSGFVTLVGRPNAGKSTLINAVMGEKVAITSGTPQTTRHRLRAVLDRPNSQLVLVDTPGLHKPQDALGEELNNAAIKALRDVDVVAMLVDASKPIGKGDAWVAKLIESVSAHKILVITKADLSNYQEIENQITRAKRLVDFDDIVVVSAMKRFNIEGFVSSVSQFLPKGPRWFPVGMRTDQSIETVISEFIREKVIRTTFDELPYSV